MEVMKANKGLAGLIAGTTAVSKVDTNLNTLLYRGYDINELCENCSFTEVAYLLFHNDLPNAEELRAFEAFEKIHRGIPEAIYETFKHFNADSHPMDLLKIGVSMLGALNPKNQLGTNSHQENLYKAKLLFAQMPNIIANGYRITHGLPIIRPNPNFSYAQNLLYMITGETSSSDLAIKTFDNSLTLYAEHGYNASTFASRVTASTLSDFYSAISSAIGTLKGALHGGANEQVMYMLLKINETSKATDFIKEKITSKEKIMGFGHRLYRTGDSRTAVIKKLGKQLGEQLGITKWHEISDIIEEIMIKEKNIYPNLDFPAATAYHLLDIPIDLFTPIFAASRLTGWAAHVMEQHDNNRLIRPSCDYIGTEKRTITPIQNR